MMQQALPLEPSESTKTAIIRDRTQLAACKNRLMLVGLAIQVIYVIYIVAFPLISNTQAGGPAADLEILMRDYRWFAPLYGGGILFLYYLFWLAMRTVQRVDTLARSTGGQTTEQFKRLVLGFGLVFGFTLVWLYPITANDLFRYVVRGRVWAIYGASPLITSPDAFPDDPYLSFAGEFGDLASGYGPLWELVVQIPLRLGATEMTAASVGLKLIVLMGYFGCALLIGWLARPQKSSALVALAFFAWNPLMLMQAPGNGHNDIVFMLLMVSGIVLWQRKVWWAAALMLSLSALAKAPAAMLLPLFGIALLRHETTWRQRFAKGAAAALIGLLTLYLVYATFGPVSETMAGLSNTMDISRRGGFSTAAWTRMLLREIIPPAIAEEIPRTTGRYIFLIFYGWLLLALWRRKLTLVTAGFLAFFSQLILWRTFRIWYPTWLIPLAALHLTPATFWRTFLFGLTAELSIINYFVVWRWWLRDWPWERLGLVTTHYYWTVMHTLTVPWVFGIPLFGPILLRTMRRQQAESAGKKNPPDMPG